MKINVKTSLSCYDIIIENGILDRIGDFIEEKRKVFVITDDNVNALYSDKINRSLNGFNFEILVLPHGENTKSLDTLKIIFSALVKYGITRSDLIIAFGGGVIGDIAGFAAATYLRGVEYIQIPSTLLSQVDSSVGGKVAADLPEGKNLIGCFYPPKIVIIDPILLKSLDKRNFNSGMAEVIKYGAICDENLFESLFLDVNEHLEDIICSCVKIKKEIVEKDEFDTGDRMILNFGHTFGHAVEKMGNYEKYTHGEAVAIGMLKITRKTEKLLLTEEGTSKRLENLLRKYDLVFDDYCFDKKNADDIIRLDKKSSGDKIKYVALKKIGSAYVFELDKSDAFLTEE